jgi:hypothetical protein
VGWISHRVTVISSHSIALLRSTTAPKSTHPPKEPHNGKPDSQTSGSGHTLRQCKKRKKEKKLKIVLVVCNIAIMDIPDFVQLGGARRAKNAGGRRTTRGSSSESSASSSVSSSPANSPRGPPQHLAHSYLAARQGRIRPQQLCAAVLNADCLFPILVQCYVCCSCLLHDQHQC